MDEQETDSVPPVRRDSRRVFRVHDSERGTVKPVIVKDGKVLKKPEPLEHIKNMPYLHPDLWW